MGRIKREDDLDDNKSRSHGEQPGCVWGLVRALNCHNWRQPNRKKTIEYAAIEKLVEAKEENRYLKARRRRTGKKKSLTARIKALIAKENSSSKPGFLHRTYSKRIIFLPDSSKEVKSARNSNLYKDINSNEPDDVLEIFKVDKSLLVKHLQDADETLAKFSRSALGLGFYRGAKFGKSRSFPAGRTSRRRKLRPVKLEDKKIEVWSTFSKDKLIQGGNENLEGLRTHRRSSSLKESLDKYTNLYEKSFLNERKLGHSKSLRAAGKSEDEHHVPTYFRRLRSTSNVDSYYSLANFEAIRDEFSRITAKERSSPLEYIEEEGQENGRENSNMDANEAVDTAESARTIDEEDEEKAREPKDNDLQTIEGFEHISDEYITSQQERAKIISKNETLTPTKKKKNSDLYYAKLLLDHSGIAIDARERTWHSYYDQPLSPRLVEEVEARHYAHERQDSSVSLWRHQMLLFDLINEKLVEIYDVSLPYYPKALSQNCHVRPFPEGNCIADEVLKSVGALLEDQERSLDRAMARDSENDYYRWMNLQIESEIKALEIEDIIFEELIEEIIYS